MTIIREWFFYDRPTSVQCAHEKCWGDFWISVGIDIFIRKSFNNVNNKQNRHHQQPVPYKKPSHWKLVQIRPINTQTLNIDLEILTEPQNSTELGPAATKKGRDDIYG